MIDLAAVSTDEEEEDVVDLCSNDHRPTAIQQPPPPVNHRPHAPTDSDDDLLPRLRWSSTAGTFTFGDATARPSQPEIVTIDLVSDDADTVDLLHQHVPLSTTNAPLTSSHVPLSTTLTSSDVPLSTTLTSSHVPLSTTLTSSNIPINVPSLSRPRSSLRSLRSIFTTTAFQVADDSSSDDFPLDVDEGACMMVFDGDYAQSDYPAVCTSQSDYPAVCTSQSDCQSISGTQTQMSGSQSGSRFDATTPIDKARSKELAKVSRQFKYNTNILEFLFLMDDLVLMMTFL